MNADTLAALAEPNRLRIVELLEKAPRSVGEIAARLGLRQPQATKHLQTLQHVGLVTMHPLGQRRIYALRREPLRELRRWLEPFEVVDHPSEDVLEQYRRALAVEQRHLDPGSPRTLTFERELAGRPAAVWRSWTSATAMRRWWSPRHFTVAECEVDPVPGGLLRIIMEEGDGSRHSATGSFIELRQPKALSFELAPLDRDGAALFSAIHDVELTRHSAGTKLSLTIRVTDARPEAAPALAGMDLGWNQLLDKLAEHLLNAKRAPGDRRSKTVARRGSDAADLGGVADRFEQVSDIPSVAGEDDVIIVGQQRYGG
jgi:uncharacterized protein YndB with AHSA1/START domain/DNA-binding transcriptional ArsR family regulator